MTKNEREEFCYDLASHYASNTTRAGLIAMAVDRMMDILLKYDDEKLLAMAPAELIHVPEKRKQNRSKAKPKGF